MTEVAPRFDYGQLDPKVGAIVAEAADKIRSHGRKAAQNVAEVGKELLRVQEALRDDRRFLAWIDAEFGWSRSTAYNYINVAKKFPTVGNDLPLVELKTLYLLAAPSTPDWVRQVAQQQSERGHGLTYTETRALIEDPHAGLVATEAGLEALRDWRKPETKVGGVPDKPRQESASPPPGPMPLPPDAVREKVLAVVAMLSRVSEKLNELGEVTGAPSGKRGDAIVKLFSKHGIEIEPDSRGKYILSALVGWAVQLHEAEEKRQKAAARAARRSKGAPS